jgi:hypothetical protein
MPFTFVAAAAVVAVAAAATLDCDATTVAPLIHQEYSATLRRLLYSIAYAHRALYVLTGFRLSSSLFIAINQCHVAKY